jgi:hypothetical protein
MLLEQARNGASGPRRKIERGAGWLLNIDAIADAYRHLHRQHPFVCTHELDIRPVKEPFRNREADSRAQGE